MVLLLMDISIWIWDLESGVFIVVFFGYMCLIIELYFCLLVSYVLLSMVDDGIVCLWSV